MMAIVPTHAITPLVKVLIISKNFNEGDFLFFAIFIVITNYLL